MERDELHRYFRGEASDEETDRILDWVESDEANREAFEQERLLFDVALFAAPAPSRRARLLSIGRWAAGIAASVLLVAGATLWADRLLSAAPAPFEQSVMAPVGQQAQLTLPDGTKVWLNSKTIITYKSDFGSKTRDVCLDGEAYFEVAKNKALPFNVLTEENRVQVVGTHFNVRAYKGSHRFETSLLEGCVDVYQGSSREAVARLAPNETYTELNGIGRKTVTPADGSQEWKDGILRFDDTPFAQMMERLEQYYNVKVVIGNHGMKGYRCTGKFKASDGIDHILGVIQKDKPFKYVYDRKNSLITIQ